MGGKALTNPSPRLTTPRLLQLVADVLNRLQITHPGLRVQPIAWYIDKPDHGDLDLLVELSPQFDPLQVAKSLQGVEVVRNGPVTSIGVEQPEGVFQIDLMGIDPQSYNFAASYFAFNDMGNLLGRVAHKAGFKLGHQGLTYVMRDPCNDAHVIDEVVVTQSWGQALRFLGYDAAVYQGAVARGGFKDLPEIFDFVASSPFINRDIFLLDNRNQKARARDSKRKTYNEFLTWIEGAAAQGRVPAFDWSKKDAVRQDMLAQAKARFPEFAGDYDAAIHRASQHAASRRRFSGDLVSKITGLTGFELGAVMREFRSRFEREDDQVAWILASNALQIEERILDCKSASARGQAEVTTLVSARARAEP